MLNCDPWVQFCKDNIMKSNYGRSEMDNVFIAVNSITYVLSAVVEDALLLYGKHSNIPKEYRKRFAMKNEFFFTKLIIAKKKKRYLSSIILREGNLYSPERIDIKGLDFMKSKTSEKAAELYNRLVKEVMLEPEQIDVKSLILQLRDFEKEIYESIRRGEKIYIPISSSKELKAYKDPYRESSVRAVHAWNVLYPDRTIELPAKINILKLNIFNKSDIDKLEETNPRIYDRIMKHIFNSPNEKISSKGLQVLAIPNSEDIPEWLNDYIDYDTIINNILGQFTAVLDILDIKNVFVGKTINKVNRKTKKFTNVLHF